MLWTQHAVEVIRILRLLTWRSNLSGPRVGVVGARGVAFVSHVRARRTSATTRVLPCPNKGPQPAGDRVLMENLDVRS